MNYTNITDKQQILSIISDPSVMRGMFREGKAPVKAFYPEKCTMFMTDNGGWGFYPLADGSYGAHIAYLPAGRGKEARDHSEWVLSQMSELCDKIQGYIALSNRAACRFVEKLGFRLETRKTGDYWIGDKKTDLGLYVYEFHN